MSGVFGINRNSIRHAVTSSVAALSLAVILSPTAAFAAPLTYDTTAEPVTDSTEIRLRADAVGSPDDPNDNIKIQVPTVIPLVAQPVSVDSESGMVLWGVVAPDEDWAVENKSAFPTSLYDVRLTGAESGPGTSLTFNDDTSVPDFGNMSFGLVTFPEQGSASVVRGYNPEYDSVSDMNCSAVLLTAGLMSQDSGSAPKHPVLIQSMTGEGGDEDAVSVQSTTRFAGNDEPGTFGAATAEQLNDAQQMVERTTGIGYDGYLVAPGNITDFMFDAQDIGTITWSAYAGVDYRAR